MSPVPVDTLIRDLGPTDAAGRAQTAEAEGWDGLWVTETAHDPFLTLGAAAPATDRMVLGTAIAVAFARNPMTVAVTANDLQEVSGGRFVLGLGTQVAAHIVKRFSMPWSRPADRMREYVAALRAIWEAWNTESRLDFRGDFYQHTLMTPNFAPSPNPFGPPAVYVAAVGPRMTEVAAETADGLLTHAFTTERFFREVTLPAVDAGLARSGRARSDLTVCGGALVVTGHDDAGIEISKAETRARIAFYASTPAYRPVLDLHGWGDVQAEARRLTQEGRWESLPDLVDDEMLHTFAVVGTPAEVAIKIRRRVGDSVDRLGLPVLAETDPALLLEIRDLLRDDRHAEDS